MESLELQAMVDEQDRINSFPVCPDEVEEYFGEVLVSIDNIVDKICDDIDFNSLTPQ